MYMNFLASSLYLIIGGLQGVRTANSGPSTSAQPGEGKSTSSQLTAEWKKTQVQEGVTFPSPILIKCINDKVCVSVNVHFHCPAF